MNYLLLTIPTYVSVLVVTQTNPGGIIENIVLGMLLLLLVIYGFFFFKLQ